ncbi:MAG: diguanylate cyclase [Candidatus Obscuribacterales bacterium]|nr:diguanylate cyclase [Candidatus Obscuribacterales bacterium]
MTYQASFDVSGEPVTKPNVLQGAIAGVQDFFGSLVIRLLAVFIFGGAALLFIGDALYPAVVNAHYAQVASQLADETKDRTPSATKILQSINKYNLAWYYVTSADGKLDLATKPYAPEMPRYDILSRNLEWKEQKYYEAVSVIGEGKLLHIGFYQGPIVGNAVKSGSGLWLLAAPMGYVFLVIGGLCLLLIAVMFLFVVKPLNLITRATGSLLLARDAYSGVTGGGLNVSGAVTEVSKVAQGLKDVRRQYDEIVAARVQKEEELRKRTLQFETDKKSLSKEFEDQITQTQAKISELYTREAEEEFINALGKELDHLRSSHQVCQRILDKLNDKFPTSIMHGVFFKADRFQRLVPDAWLGFDDRSVQPLKKIDHTKIAREVFSSGKHLTLGPDGIREYGLTQVTQPNGIKTVVFLPIVFQNRNLGVLAIYFNAEGQVVQDRLRVLRNVVELASRVVHQNVQYEEEQEAARTDPLTGLRNKKFFYEIMPQVMDRAAVNPEQHPLSLMIMDGDHFKSINDTYGHQVGDQMLQELSKLIRTCVRTQEGNERNNSGDYLIRFGGEEFIIVMENTEAKRALSVAERIRQQIEAKSDWPAGIVKWTVSIGVATFPVDGKTADDLLTKADTALYYVKEELGRNKSCHSQQVPKSYKSSKSAAAIGGELGVFDPAALLQSLGTAQKTGILTVQGADGRQFWMLFESGKPIQARMGKYAGAAAVVEFVSTFEEGNFNFQEKNMSGRETMSKLPRLDESFNIGRALERLLMDAALAQDNFTVAKKALPTLNMLIRPVSPAEFAARWKQLGEIPEPPLPDEYNVMSNIVQKADGNTTLQNIFRSLDGTPTHVLWRAAQLLVQNGLVQTKIVQ